MKHNRRGITIEAIKEALSFIEENWGQWEGDFQDFMANVIADKRVSSYDVERVLRTHKASKPIEGLQGLSVKGGEPRDLSAYEIVYIPQ